MIHKKIKKKEREKCKGVGKCASLKLQPSALRKTSREREDKPQTEKIFAKDAI